MLSKLTLFLTFRHHKGSLFCPVQLTAGPHPNTSLKSTSTLCPITSTSLCLHNSELKFSYSFLSCHSCYITRPSHPPLSRHSNNTTCLLYNFILHLFLPLLSQYFFRIWPLLIGNNDRHDDCKHYTCNGKVRSVRIIHQYKLN